MTWQSRIVDHEMVAPETLVAHPKNWRTHPRHQGKAVEDALDKIGWISDVIVNRTSGRLVDGHLRVGLAVSRGESAVPVSFVELDEDEERIVLASLDPLSALAVSDEAALMGLLADIQGCAEEFTGMVGWLYESGSAPPKPSQDQIDAKADELALRFADGPDGTGIEVTCPKCGMGFGLAGIGITS